MLAVQITIRDANSESLEIVCERTENSLILS